jgi:hypothetical protein
LSDDILEIIPQAEEDCHSPWTTLLETAIVDLLNNSEFWNFDTIVDIIFSFIKS